MTASFCHRYVTALEAVARKHSLLERILEDLTALETLIVREPFLQTILHNPLYRKSAQNLLFDTLGQVLNLSVFTLNFLKTVAHHRRLPLLLPIIQAFITRIAYPQKEVSITTATPLTSAQHAALKALFPEARLRIAVDQRLLGGMILQIGSYMLDSSLQTKLAKISLIST